MVFQAFYSFIAVAVELCEVVTLALQCLNSCLLDACSIFFFELDALDFNTNVPGNVSDCFRR